jgi:predicted nucleic acid-binding protein
MILVDASLIIDFIKGKRNPKVLLFEAILKQGIPYGIASYTYQEVLQGARDLYDFVKLDSYLSTQRIYFLPEKIEMYKKAADMFYTLRRRGITVRSTIDVLIAMIAIYNDLFLLHNDKDFDAIANEMPQLKIFDFIL